MTLPVSGPLTIANIQTEFGGSNPAGLSEYYAGGTYVPSGTTGVNGAVPSSGTIAISDFYGTSVSVGFSNHTLRSNDSGSGGPATVSLFLYANGVARGTVTSAAVAYNIDGVTTTTRTFNVANGYSSNQWLTSGTATDYTVRATWTPTPGGDTPTGSPLGSWIQLGSSTVSWTLSQTLNDTDGDLLVEFSTVASGNSVIIQTGTVTMIAFGSL